MLAAIERLRECDLVPESSCDDEDEDGLSFLNMKESRNATYADVTIAMNVNANEVGLRSRPASVHARLSSCSADSLCLEIRVNAQ